MDEVTGQYFLRMFKTFLSWNSHLMILSRLGDLRCSTKKLWQISSSKLVDCEGGLKHQCSLNNWKTKNTSRILKSDALAIKSEAKLIIIINFNSGALSIIWWKGADWRFINIARLYSIQCCFKFHWLIPFTETAPSWHKQNFQKRMK